MDVNQVTLTGVVERDPVTKTCESGAMLGLTLRVTEIGQSGQEFKTFVPCELYSHTMAQAEQVRAGDAILVSGKVKWTSWTDKQGQKRSSLAILVRLVKALGTGQPHTTPEA